MRSPSTWQLVYQVRDRIKLRIFEDSDKNVRFKSGQPAKKYTLYSA